MTMLKGAHPGKRPWESVRDVCLAGELSPSTKRGEVGSQKPRVGLSHGLQISQIVRVSEGISEWMVLGGPPRHALFSGLGDFYNLNNILIVKERHIAVWRLWVVLGSRRASSDSTAGCWRLPA